MPMPTMQPEHTVSTERIGLKCRVAYGLLAMHPSGYENDNEEENTYHNRLRNDYLLATTNGLFAYRGSSS